MEETVTKKVEWPIGQNLRKSLSLELIPKSQGRQDKQPIKV